MEQPFKLSNSKLHDWETMCPLEFKAKHITKTQPVEPATEPMCWGNYFETLVIGGGIGGAFSFSNHEFGEKMKRSVYKERVEEQAKRCKNYLKIMGGKIISRQEYISQVVKNPYTGQEIPIEGTLDIRYLMPGGTPKVIDLKTTGDSESEFGKFAWGRPEKMDLSQIKHYKCLADLSSGQPHDAEYWVFDYREALKHKLIKCVISESAMWDHIQRLTDVYNEIQACIAMDDWQPRNTFENCSKCKSPCKFRRIMPEYHIIEL